MWGTEGPNGLGCGRAEGPGTVTEMQKKPSIVGGCRKTPETALFCLPKMMIALLSGQPIRPKEDLGYFISIISWNFYLF